MQTAFRNPSINEARHAALAVLNPTRAELERGLELHRQCLVVESYGFSAVAAPDAQALKAATESGADREELIHLRVKQMMTRMADDAAEREDFTEAWEAAGVTAVLRNSGEEGNRIDRLIERMAHNTYVTDRLPQFMMRAAWPADIREAKRQGRHCFYLTTNGVPLRMAQDSPENELRHIDIFFQLGIRMMHLTYNRRNAIGDGCAEPVDGGLSDFGRAVVREMNRVGVIVDGAHSSQKTCLDMAKVSTKPVVVSHSTCMALNEHCRAKTDEVISAVAATGGVMGICCIPAFLGGSGDIAAFLDHIDHVVKLVGAEHVAIGTDVGAHSRAAGEQQAASPAVPPGRRPWESYWPPDDALFDKKWHQPHMAQSLAWTNFPLFTVGMVQRGYRDEQIAAILGGNIMRVAEAVLAP